MKEKILKKKKKKKSNKKNFFKKNIIKDDIHFMVICMVVFNFIPIFKWYLCMNFIFFKLIFLVNLLHGV